MPRTGQAFSKTTRYALGGLLFMRGNSLFLARTVNGNVSVDPINIPDDDIGIAFLTHDITGGVLIRGLERPFLARVVDGAITVEPAGNADTGFISSFSSLSDDRVLIVAQKGCFLRGSSTTRPSSI
jgi:hypothetical protein